MKHLKTYRIFENDNFRPSSGGYLDNDHLETERAAKQLPPEVKKALEDVVSKLSPSDIEALKKQLAGVTQEDIEDAVEDAQSQSQEYPENSRPGSMLDNDHLGTERAATNENFLKKTGSFISRNKGTIGATLFVLGIAGLGVRGEQLSHITNALRGHEIFNLLKDPALVASCITNLLGLVMTASVVKQGFKQAGESAKLAKEEKLIKMKVAKRDANGDLVGTGIPYVIRNGGRTRNLSYPEGKIITIQ